MVSVEIAIKSYDIDMVRKTVTAEVVMGHDVHAFLSFCEEAWKAYHRPSE